MARPRCVLKLEPISFRYHGPDDDGQSHLGLIADEVAAILPEVTGEMVRDGETLKTLSPGLLVYPLILAVQELAARLEALEARVNPS
jgi:hypothetical protein